MATMILKDNTPYSSDNFEEYLSFNNIANRKISELLDDKGNDLLVYPHSFSQCEDEMGVNIYFRYKPTGKIINVQKLYWKQEIWSAS